MSVESADTADDSRTDDRFEAPDRAWSGTLDDQALLDELVADGTLTEV